MLKDLSVAEFSERLASGDPAPGGGSGSAAVAALGAGLLVMTCNLTIGKEEHADSEGELREVMEELKALRVWYLASIDRDAEAYDRVMDAFAMPKTTPEEKSARREAIQDSLKTASNVPMELARRCARSLDLAQIVAELGNPNTISDTGCGARFLMAAMQGALYNVGINLGSIKDGDYCTGMSAEVEELKERSARALENVLHRVEDGMF